MWGRNNGPRWSGLSLTWLTGRCCAVAKETFTFFIAVEAAPETLWYGRADAWRVTATTGALLLLLHQLAILGTVDRRTERFNLADTLKAAAAIDELLALFGAGTQ